MIEEIKFVPVIRSHLRNASLAILAPAEHDNTEMLSLLTKLTDWLSLGVKILIMNNGTEQRLFKV